MFNYNKENIFKLLLLHLVIFIGLIIIFSTLGTKFLFSGFFLNISGSLISKGITLWCLSLFFYYSFRSSLMPREENTIFTKIIHFIFTPVITLDKHLKYNRYTKQRYNNLMFFLINKISSLSNNRLRLIRLIFEIFPYIILLTCVILNILYYKMRFILLLPIALRYMIYCFNEFKEHMILCLKEKYDAIIVHEKGYEWEMLRKYNTQAKYHYERVSIEEYILIKANNILDNLNNVVTYIYIAYPMPKDTVIDDYCMVKYNDPKTKLTSEDSDNIKKLFQDFMPKILDIQILLYKKFFLLEKENIVKWFKMMNLVITKYDKKIIYYFILILAIFCIIWMFYIRFIRERIFRNIPFNLTEFWFYILIGLIAIYLYAMKNIIKPAIPNEFLRNLLQCIIAPYILLDQRLKINKYTVNYNITILKHITSSLPYGQTRLYIVTHLIPRIIILSVFLTDVFWYNHLEKFYYFLLLGIFPLLYNYHKFSMYHAKEISLTILESLYTFVIIYEEGWDQPRFTYEYDEYDNLKEIPIDPPWEPNPRNKYHETTVTVREYFDICVEKILDEAKNDYELFTNDNQYGKDYYEFDPQPLSKEHRCVEYKEITGKTELEIEDYAILRKEFNDIAPSLIDLCIHLHYLPNMEKRFYIPWVNFIIYTLYFIGWSYILCKSFHNLTDVSLTLNLLKFMRIYMENQNPFING